MNNRVRPLQTSLYSGLLLSSGLVMCALGFSSGAFFFVPAAALFLQAFLLWRGMARRFFAGLLNLNQLSSGVLLLLAWTGLTDSLSLPILEVAAVLLVASLITGGPLMAILAIPLLINLHFGKTLPDWFASRAG